MAEVVAVAEVAGEVAGVVEAEVVAEVVEALLFSYNNTVSHRAAHIRGSGRPRKSRLPHRILQITILS